MKGQLIGHAKNPDAQNVPHHGRHNQLTYLPSVIFKVSDASQDVSEILG